MSLESVLVTATTLLLVLSCHGHCLILNIMDTFCQIIPSSYLLTFMMALKCVTDNGNSTHVGGWRDERGRPVYQGADGVTCLYFTRGDGVMSLHRKTRGCIDHSSGLWRCGIPDSSGKMQSLYAYIGQNERHSNPPGKDM